MISARLATMAELQTVYSLEDLYDLGEILTIDAKNRQTMDEWHASKMKG